MHKSSAPVQWSTTLFITSHLTACQAFINYTCCFPIFLWQAHSHPQCHLCQQHSAQAATCMEDCSAELFLPTVSQLYFFLASPSWKATGNVKSSWTGSTDHNKKVICLGWLRSSPRHTQKLNLVTRVSADHLWTCTALFLRKDWCFSTSGLHLQITPRCRWQCQVIQEGKSREPCLPPYFKCCNTTSPFLCTPLLETLGVEGFFSPHLLPYNQLKRDCSGS